MADRLEFAAPEFFKADPRKLKVDETPEIGRIHYLLKGRVVAVAVPEKDARQ